MKQQLQDFSKSKPGNILRILPVLTGMVLFFMACETDVARINALLDDMNIPNEAGKNIEVQYTDSGKVQLIFKAPVSEHYTDKDEHYYEFPEGIEVFSYDKNEVLESTVRAGYAIFFEEKQLWEARDSVVARNAKSGENLTTEQMFWDQKKEFFYSDVFTKIVNEDGTFYGENGFEAQQNLERYKLKGSTGTVNVKEEPEEQTTEQNEE